MAVVPLYIYIYFWARKAKAMKPLHLGVPKKCLLCILVIITE